MNIVNFWHRQQLQLARYNLSDLSIYDAKKAQQKLKKNSPTKLSETYYSSALHKIKFENRTFFR